MKSRRVLLLCHPDFIPPESKGGFSEEDVNVWKTEYDVASTLRGLGHEVRPLGVVDELTPIRRAVEEFKPHIVFNLLEEFAGLPELDQHVVSYLELLGVKYTGCNPGGLVLARGKGIAKKLLTYHRIATPAFAVFPRNRRVRRPRALKLPLIVKSLVEESSMGISQASIVDSDEKLEQRVKFVHESIGTDAIVEEYIEGRELYVGIFGNKRTTVLPTWELVFENLPAGSAAIATEKVKHDIAAQKRWGIFHVAAELDEPQEAAVQRTTKRIYRILQLDGYARIDYRLTPDGQLYFLEANPNPEIAASEELASSANAAGMSYPQLLEKIVRLGLRRGA